MPNTVFNIQNYFSTDSTFYLRFTKKPTFLEKRNVNHISLYRYYLPVIYNIQLPILWYKEPSNFILRGESYVLSEISNNNIKNILNILYLYMQKGDYTLFGSMRQICKRTLRKKNIF